MRRRLNELLKDWATSATGASDDHLERLGSRISQELARTEQAALHREPRTQRGTTRWPRLAFAGLAVAAAVAVGIVLWPRNAPSRATTDDIAPATLAEVSASELRRSARLFHETATLFPHSLEWIADSEEDVRLGLAGGRRAIDLTQPRMLIRLVVVCRREGDNHWTRVWSTDILAHAEQLVKAAPDPRRNNSFVFWLLPLEDGNIAVDLRIVLRSPIRAACETTDVLEPGKPSQVFSLKARGSEYRVLQVVVKLPDEGRWV